MTRKTKQSNLQIIKVWYLAQIRNRSMQVAVPKAPGTQNYKPSHEYVKMHTSWLPSCKKSFQEHERFVIAN
jgi:hypothetical protein